ncbi:threonine synthase [Hortaea werneckii]|nr:threonine synthase [Hortaea werneckii]KAI7323868.1 threonine synthase [Hortaea werneckii]KAI7403517.1 threonine synthase [Hortaea werneckii]KAI7489443.1 threonine synthase [Hortaea werneckii]
MSGELSASQPELTSKRDLASLCEVEDFETGFFLRTTFTFVDPNHNAWFGQVPGIRKYDLHVEDVRRNLRRIPDEAIYPELTAGLTVVADNEDLSRYHIKRPKLLCLDDVDEAQLLPEMLLEEARILEHLQPHGHRNLVRYFGCVAKQDRIAGIALEKYDVILQYRLEDDPRPLDATACISGIRAGIEFLHSLGFAHNDLNPMNIAFDKDDQPVILDFGSCRKVGDPLLSGGTPGWVDEDHATSSRDHDNIALQKLDLWLGEQLKRKREISLEQIVEEPEEQRRTPYRMTPKSAAQRYLSTRGGSYDFSFEDVVLKGLASDGGLFIPEEIASLPSDWHARWKDLSFEELAYEIYSLYISREEIPEQDLKNLIHKSYSTFRAKDITPSVTLDEQKNLHLLELFHGPTFAFKDVALQFLGNLFEYFLVRRNKGKEPQDPNREHLTVVGATSGDTGSAAIYGLRGKKDVSVFIMHPKGKVSPIQEAQMTTVLDANVHNLAVEGTFDDCQDIVKALFADPDMNSTHRLAAVNSINWARILAQITYYFYAYFSLVRKTGHSNPTFRFIVPTGNFGDIMAGYFATRMGLPADKLIIATNENDILHRFWKTGFYEKMPVHGKEAEGGLVEDGVKAAESGVKETLTPAMDILVSSNFERLLWFLAYRTSSVEETNRRRMEAGEKVKNWLDALKKDGGFGVNKEILAAAKENFDSERVSDKQTIQTIKDIYGASLSSTATQTDGHNTAAPATTGTQHNGHYILDPHSAIGITASLRSITACTDSAQKTGGDPAIHHISLATAHPAKFSHAVELALKDVEGFTFEKVLPEQFVGLEEMEKRCLDAPASWERVKGIVRELVEKEVRAKMA